MSFARCSLWRNQAWTRSRRASIRSNRWASRLDNPCGVGSPTVREGPTHASGPAYTRASDTKDRTFSSRTFARRIPQLKCVGALLFKNKSRGLL